MSTGDETSSLSGPEDEGPGRLDAWGAAWRWAKVRTTHWLKPWPRRTIGVSVVAIAIAMWVPVSTQLLPEVWARLLVSAVPASIVLVGATFLVSWVLAPAGQRNALRAMIRAHDAAFHPSPPNVTFAHKLRQATDGWWLFQLELDGAPHGLYEARGLSYDGNDDRWSIPWGHAAADHLELHATGGGTMQIAFVRWDEHDIASIRLIRVGTRDRGRAFEYNVFDEHRLSGNRFDIVWTLSSAAFGDGSFTLTCPIWREADASPRSEPKAVFGRHPIVPGS